MAQKFIDENYGSGFNVVYQRIPIKKYHFSLV